MNQYIFFDIFFLIFDLNIDCGYMLEPPRRGSSNENPQSIFWSQNKKNGNTVQTPVLQYKKGIHGAEHVFLMDMFS